MKENNYCKGQRQEFSKNDYRGYRYKVSIATVSQISEETKIHKQANCRRDSNFFYCTTRGDY